MSAVRAVLGQAFRREDDDAPVAARSRRDWIVDSVLFLLAAVLALASAHDQRPARAARPAARHRRDRRGDGLPRPVVAAALAAGSRARRGGGPDRLARGRAGRQASSLYTVAAYRRWQLAFLVAAAQVALLPLGACDPAPGHLAGGVLPHRHARPGGDRRLGHVPPHPPPGAARTRTPRRGRGAVARRADPLRRAHPDRA